jgi:N-acetylneuraminate lyase
MKKLQGLIAAPHTPFAHNGDVNIETIAKQADLLFNQGVKGVYICGTTGEGLQLSVAERKAVAEKWVKSSAGRLVVIVHTGALSLVDAKELSCHAQDIGADATSVIAPCFFKPGSIDALVDYCAAVAGEAPDLPFYYYHSGMSGVALNMKQFLKAASKKMPNLAGIKFNDPDLYSFQQCTSVEDGKFDISWGVDEFYAAALVYGTESAVGSTYNYMAPLFVKMTDAFNNNDLETVRELSKKVVKLVDILVEFGGVAAGKAIMAMHGIDCGDPRLPIPALTDAQKQDIIQRVEALGVIQK